MFKYNFSYEALDEDVNEITTKTVGVSLVAVLVTSIFAAHNKPAISSAELNNVPLPVITAISQETASFTNMISRDQNYVNKYCTLDSSSKAITSSQTTETRVHACNEAKTSNRLLKVLGEQKVKLTHTSITPIYKQLYIMHKNKWYKINAEHSLSLIYNMNMSRYNFELETELLKKDCTVSKYEEKPSFDLIDKSTTSKVLTNMDISVELVCLKNDKDLEYKKLPTFNAFNYKIN